MARRLKLSASSLAMASFVVVVATAQTEPPTDSIETVLVTGTSIRGVAPVGSNLVSVGPEEIQSSGAQTLAQVLENVPSLTGMGNAGQGQIQGSYFQPTIHSLGASASNTTLVLVDGHRIAAGGTNHTSTDPNILPVAAVERVEVLADGASSIYGSDAVAGVVNFITRSKFDGAQLGVQASFIDGASDLDFNTLAGTSWNTGSVMFAYTYSYKGQLKDTSRPYTAPDHTAQGGTNFNTFYCSPASIQMKGDSVIYTSPTSGVAVANTAANSPCNAWAYGSLLPAEVRNNALIKGVQNFGENFTLTGELVYGTRRDKGITTRGTVSATVFQTGSQANPFYVVPTGYTGTATSEAIKWNADQLLGPGALSLDGSDSFYGDVTGQYRIGSNFVVDVLAAAGRDDSFTNTTGTINTSVANLALNGTTNSSGSLTTPSLPGSNAIITQLPLTSANALDIWHPAGSNLTSAAVLAALTDNANMNRQVNGFQQFRISTNGSLFELPAGAVKVAIGGEWLRTQLYEFTTTGNNAGPASSGSTQLQFNFHRTVYSFYGELDIPLVSPDMAIPLVHKLDLDISGRYDDYSDFGVTANPKFAFDWELMDGLKVRGNMSTSFVAPTLDILGDANGIYNNSRYQSYTTSTSVPVAAYPLLPTMGIVGCTATSVTCNISTLTGVRINTGDHSAGAQKGRGWSIGVDYAPEYIPGLSLQATLWNDKFTGGITGPTPGVIANTPSMQQFLTFYPAGATAAQLAALTPHIPQIGALPSKVSYILDVINSNWLNLNVRGIDASFTYQYKTDDMGTFKLGDSLTEFVKFDESYGNGATYSVLNTSGANNTFPSVATQMRANLGWTYAAFSTDLFMNYTGAYRNLSGSSVAPILTDAAGNPTGGGDHVHANITFDVHLAYDFSGIFGDDEIGLTVRNLFDKNPPFYNSAAGYDTYVANPIGRMVTLSLVAKL